MAEDVAQAGEAIHTVMTAPAGELGAVLPAGVVRYEKPLTSRDYVLANPMDQKAIDTILYDAVCETRQAMAPGARLYLVMGENHAQPQSSMTIAGLLDNMAVAKAQAGESIHGALLYGIENPYNSLQFYMRRVYMNGLQRWIQSFYQPHKNKKIRKTLHEHDPLGHHFARAVMADNRMVFAPQSLNRVFNACLQHRIPLALIDAARTRNDRKVSIDFSQDVLACESAQRLYKGFDPLRDSIGMIDKRGITIRNAVMARRIVDAAQKHQADTVVVSTGLYHLGGFIPDNLPQDMSLSAFLEQEKQPQDKILSVCIDEQRSKLQVDNIIPHEFWQCNPDTVVFRGVEETLHFGYGPPTWENDYIAKMGCSYGDNIPARFSLPELPKRSTVKWELRELVRRAGQSLALPEPF